MDRYCKQCGAPIPYPVGTVFSKRVRVERLLAKGGFSFVYLGTDLKTEGLLIVKDMYCENPNEQEPRLNFFRREAKVLDFLKNVAAVPRLYGYYEKNQVARLFMEYVPGQDLIDVMCATTTDPSPSIL